MGFIKCYNTLTGSYEDVEVSEEVYTYFNRSTWREDKQLQRWNSRKLQLLDDYGYGDDIDPVFEEMLYTRLVKFLQEAVEVLSPLEQYVINLVFFKNLTYTEASRILGYSITYTSRVCKRALNKMYIYLSRYNL